MRTAITWLGDWITCFRIAPPLSRRRRDLLSAIREADLKRNNPDYWVEVARPTDGGAA